MNQNPEKVSIFKEFCKKHPKNMFEFICDKQQCEYYLSFQCYQCRQDNIEFHSHQCPRSNLFVQKLHQELIDSLKQQVEKEIEKFKSKLEIEIAQLRHNLYLWYSPMDQKTTEKQFVYTVENPSKRQKIIETSLIKSALISYRLAQINLSFRKQMNEAIKILDVQMSELKYPSVSVQWKFDKNHSHELLNISGFRDKTVDKKSQKQKYCAAIVNQPITPFKNEISFTINSQNPYDHFIVIGVCNKRQMANNFYEASFQRGICAIYQAAKSGSSNNAFSLHSYDKQMHYKQAVGWNFRSGELISIVYTLMDQQNVRIQFRKKKQVFELLVKKHNAFLHPFIALYSAGDKVSIDLT